jgi:hypothetical protein
MQLVLPATSAFGKEEAGKFPFRPYIQMLANNNISAGRVITKMQFDTKSTHPRVVFSPVGVVPEAAVRAVQTQKESSAAENAVKLTVYQQDEADGDTEVAAPATDAPIVRESKKPEASPTSDVSDVIKKWSKKG